MGGIREVRAVLSTAKASSGWVRDSERGARVSGTDGWGGGVWAEGGGVWAEGRVGKRWEERPTGPKR